MFQCFDDPCYSVTMTRVTVFQWPVFQCFDDLMSEHGFGRCWQSMRDERRRAVVLKLMDRLELSKRDARMKGSRSAERRDPEWSRFCTPSTN